jgi:hypothetical protein
MAPAEQAREYLTEQLSAIRTDADALDGVVSRLRTHTYEPANLAHAAVTAGVEPSAARSLARRAAENYADAVRNAGEAARDAYRALDRIRRLHDLATEAAQARR